MISTKKIVSLIVCVLILLSVCLAFVGCKEEEEPSYDVTFVVVCQEAKDGVGNPSGTTLESWTVTPDMGTLDVERDYDGKSYVYFVYQYNLPDHPELGDVWFVERRVKYALYAEVFVQTNYKLATERGKPTIRYNYVKDRGVYTKEITINPLPGLNKRHLVLTITIK